MHAPDDRLPVKSSHLKNHSFSKKGRTRIQRLIMVLALLTSPMLFSCSAVKSIGESLQSFQWGIQKSMRKPGEKMLYHPDKAWDRYKCDGKTLPMLQIDEMEVLPPRLYAGEELNHHLIYAMCPEKPSQVIRGKLTRSISYKSEVIFQDVTRDFEFKPGKWSIDAFITIPAEAEPGVYSLEAKLTGTKQNFSKSLHFVVKPPDD